MMARVSHRQEFEGEVLEHLPSLLAVANRLMRNGSEAEDLVQDSVLKAIRARDQFESGTNLKAWLLKILTNTFINRYRRGGLERSVLDGPDADPLADGWVSAATMEALRDPESQALRRILEAEIHQALQELPTDFRLAVVLSDIEDLSYKEISDIMGCPIGTVMSRLHRGRRILKSRLYEHALALGIVGPEAAVGAANAEQPVVEMETYRKRKGARA
ncbi:MAG TPA: sigma-70 family RNA polymerase sigma factor [Polyangiaceae bacterium]|nr:sigma-70 family RNA polymerase sigma factor [Polyangiaceae bacterium]